LAFGGGDSLCPALKKGGGETNPPPRLSAKSKIKNQKSKIPWIAERL
jgi:hypothetical protein